MALASLRGSIVSGAKRRPPRVAPRKPRLLSVAPSATLGRRRVPRSVILVLAGAFLDS
jgi:hypothetical protein